MSADESTVEKEKNFVVPVQTPSSLMGTAVEKHAVRCAQQVPANSTEILLNKPEVLPSLLCLCWRGIKSKNADTKKTVRLDDEIKWNFYCIGLAWVSHAGCAGAAVPN